MSARWTLPYDDDDDDAHWCRRITRAGGRGHSGGVRFRPLCRLAAAVNSAGQPHHDDWSLIWAAAHRRNTVIFSVTLTVYVLRCDNVYSPAAGSNAANKQNKQVSSLKNKESKFTKKNKETHTAARQCNKIDHFYERETMPVSISIGKSLYWAIQSYAVTLTCCAWFVVDLSYKKISKTNRSSGDHHYSSSFIWKI